ncbi:MAG: GIN domain-containing protein [Brevundimonas sp.]
MIRNLLVITGVGFVLALVGIGGAVALVGNDVQRHDWIWVATEGPMGDDSIRFERGEVDPEVTRTLAWTGGDRLSLMMPGQVVYRQGETAGVTVTGPRGMVERVRLRDGRLSLADYDEDAPERGYIRWSRKGIHAWSETDALKVVVTAPAVTRFDTASNGRLVIEDYQQPRMELVLNGSGDVRAWGETDALAVTLNGSGDVDLDRLVVTDARVEVNGRGDVEVGPTGRADIEVSGRGDVTLTRTPEQLVQSVTGWGEVEQD